ncbi:MAG: YegS/Rv2252/BmrU family lipid kinase [Lachnospiraceae bacterium]|nr:YegS/Rv2252/BmrU family lipid kinase [Lachnospiraceae bacterium]
MDETKKMLFIFNPKAGKAQIKTNLLGIIDTFVKAGYQVETYPTQGEKDAIYYTKKRAGEFDIVVCSGGDGTLDEVVAGLLQSGVKVPLGYVPAGSTNDFAGSLKLPKTMLKAAKTVVDGADFACDIGTFNDQTFVYIAAFGLFTDVSYGTQQELKNVLGHMAYLLEGIKSLSAIKSYPMKFSYGEEVLEGDFIYGMITNSMSVGGFKGITGPEIYLNDGLFEVTLIRNPKTVAELNDLITALVNKDFSGNMLCHFKTDRLRVESQVEVDWTLDGEYGGGHWQLLIENKKEAISFRVSEKFVKENQKNR